MKNKTILIAGGAKSLGKYLSVNFSKNNKVIVLDKDENKLVELKKDYPNINTLVCDLTNESDVIKCFKEIKNLNEIPNLVIYNAGFAVSNKITDFKASDFDICMKINLYGYFYVAKYASKLMIENKVEGSIIQINSKSGRIGSKFNSGYSAAKFGGVGLTQSLALDLAEHNIRVNALMLGNLLDSEMFESLVPAYSKKLNIAEEKVKQFYIDKVPLRRGCQFSDVFNMICFYGSDFASYCTGQSINVTGGQVM